MLWPFYMSCIVFAAYILYILHNNTHPASLSDTYYMLQQKGTGWVFQLMIITVSTLILPVWLQVSLPNIQFLPFLACSGLAFVGVAPAFKLELDSTVHSVSATISGLASVIWMIGSGLWYIVVTGVLIAYVMSLQYRNLLFCLELVAFVCIYVSILIL